MKYTFWFECTDNGGGHQGFVVKAGGYQEGHGVCKETCFG